MAKKPQSDREKAARAICRFHDVPEDVMFEDNPMWMSYLPEIDVVLEAIGWRDASERKA